MGWNVLGNRLENISADLGGGGGGGGGAVLTRNLTKPLIYLQK